MHLNGYADMSRIAPVVKAHPEVTFVLTHLAAGEPEVVEEIAEQCPNALFDTSIALSGEHCIDRIHNDFWEEDSNVVSFFRRIGCTRFAFGSDYPFGNPVRDIARIRNMDLTDAEKALILGANAAKLYGVDGPRR